MGVTVIGLAIAIPFRALEVYYAGTYVRAHQSKSARDRDRSKKKMDAYRMDEELATAISVLEGILGEDDMWNAEQERDVKTEQDEMRDAESKTEQDEMWDDLPSEVLEEIIKGDSEMQNIK